MLKKAGVYITNLLIVVIIILNVLILVSIGWMVINHFTHKKESSWSSDIAHQTIVEEQGVSLMDSTHELEKELVRVAGKQSAVQEEVEDSELFIEKDIPIGMRQQRPLHRFEDTFFCNDYDDSENISLADDKQTPGAILAPDNAPCFVIYKIKLPYAGQYELWAEYASEEERPARVLLDDELIAEEALNNITKDFSSNSLTWFKETLFSVEAPGEYVLQIESDHDLPHLNRLKIIQIKQKLPPKSLREEEIAKDEIIIETFTKEFELQESIGGNTTGDLSDKERKAFFRKVAIEETAEELDIAKERVQSVVGM